MARRRPVLGVRSSHVEVPDDGDFEFLTKIFATDVAKAIRETLGRVEDVALCQAAYGKATAIPDIPYRNIVDIVHGQQGRLIAGPLSEREWRIIRYCLSRTMETIQLRLDDYREEGA